MAMSRRMPSRGEKNIYYAPEEAAYAEGKEVFEEGYVHPLARASNYQARMPEPEPEPPSIAEEIDPYLARLGQAEVGLNAAEENIGATIERHRERARADEAEWARLQEKRRKLEEELSKPRPAPKEEPPPPPAEKKPTVPKVAAAPERQVMMVEYKDDLQNYIQNLLNAQIPLPRHLYIKDIDQEIDLLGRIKDEEGNLLAERWFADDELLRSDTYQKEFQNAVAPGTEKQKKEAAKTSEDESNRRIQALIKEYQEMQRELESALNKAKGK